MSEAFKVACVQNCASPVIQDGISDTARLIGEAADQGAELICTAEFFTCLDVGASGLVTGVMQESVHPALEAFMTIAEHRSVYLLLGSLAIRDESGLVRNRSYLINSLGDICARYNKIHMFDVDLANGESYRESDSFDSGDTAVVAHTPWGGLGLSVCYDLRFAYLYRALAQAGASFLTVPAAFMKSTGQAHWHTLLRSRAIETGSYVFAPCQYGRHGRATTYGHSLIVDPWGKILADCGESRGIVLAEVDPEAVVEARRMIPALGHDRSFSVSTEKAPLLDRKAG